MILPVKHMSSITQVKQEVDYQDFKACDIKEVMVWVACFEDTLGVATPLLKKGAIVLGKSLGQKALKTGVKLAQDYLGYNKRNSNQIKHVISSRAVKRGGPPRKRTKRYILLNMSLIHPLSCECVKNE